MTIVADQILPAGADRTDRAAWLDVRTTGIGSSDVSAILGLSRWRSARHVWEEKAYGISEDTAGEAARWGTLLEPVVCAEWSQRTGIAVTSVGIHRSRRWPWMLASPDGLTADGGLYEGKTASAWTSTDWEDGQVPDHAELQVQHGMAVMGLSHAWVVGLIGGQKLAWQRIERDDELVEMIVDAERRFWHDHVLAEVPPPLDGSEAAEAWVKARFPLAQSGKTVEIEPETADLIHRTYASAKSTKQADEDAFRAAQTLIRDLLGDAEELVCQGKTVATWRNNGSSFDEDAFRAAHPEIAAQFTTTQTIEVLDRKALREAHPEIASQFRNRVLRVSSK